jgi:hypothetical protein
MPTINLGKLPLCRGDSQSLSFQGFKTEYSCDLKKINISVIEPNNIESRSQVLKDSYVF